MSVASQATMQRAPTRTAGDPRSLRRRGGWVERIIEIAIRAVALLSIAAILLILLFVGKEALPLLTSSDVHREVTFGSLFEPLRQSGESAYTWQPVSEDFR